LLDGRYFSNPAKTFDPLNFTIGSNSVIPGFEKIITYLKKGSVVRTIIPYYLSYGAGNGIASNGQIAIPLYSSLYYEIKITSVTK
jgi:FKBP-type peptidyl-prolyl cis-trans isomerase